MNKKSERKKLLAARGFQKWAKNNNEQIKATAKLDRLFKYGNIDNNEFTCAICNKQPIDKHHENYDLWYVFIPLCHKCHIHKHHGY